MHRRPGVVEGLEHQPDRCTVGAAKAEFSARDVALHQIVSTLDEFELDLVMQGAERGFEQRRGITTEQSAGHRVGLEYGAIGPADQ